ncbi:hypothetical protein SDC9_166639 [bioreactor metagenome]|uniref:Uncharacterized protein n=1 Tax=bioreactor metagenome TaxID=1076179 RepID=A0A645G003_9ZZZZ
MLANHPDHEVVQHDRQHIKALNGSLLQRTDDLDVAGFATQHLIGLQPDGNDVSGFMVNRQHCRLIEHNSPVTGIDQDVG